MIIGLQTKRGKGVGRGSRFKKSKIFLKKYIGTE